MSSKMQQKHYFRAINEIIRTIPQCYLHRRNIEDIVIRTDNPFTARRWSFEIEAAAWATGCRITLNSDRGDYDRDIVQYSHVTLGWSSCGRGVASATAAIAVYQEALRVASLIEALVESTEVVPDISTISDDDMAMLLKTSRIEIDYSDGSTGDYNSVEEARQTIIENVIDMRRYSPDALYVEAVRAYDREDAQICNFNVGWFLGFDLEDWWNHLRKLERDKQRAKEDEERKAAQSAAKKKGKKKSTKKKPAKNA